MRHPTDIQKIEREKRQEKREELRDIASPLKTKRKLKSHISTRPKYLPESRERRPDERKGEFMLEDSTIVPKDLSELRENRPEERKDEASSSSSIVGVIQTTSEILLNIVLQNQELAIATTTNPMSSYSWSGSILQRDLQIKPGEASIWSWLDALGQISSTSMIHKPLYGNSVMITPEFGSYNIIIQYFDSTTSPPPASTTYFRTA